MQTDRSLRKERGVNREAFKGHNSQGRTIGIVGIGNVGKRVAHICRQTPPRLVNPEAWETFADRFEAAFSFRPTE